MRRLVTCQPGRDRCFLVQQLLGIFDERLHGSKRAFQPLNSQKTVLEVLRRQVRRFACPQTVPEAHQEQNPVPLARGFSMPEDLDELIAIEMFHVTISGRPSSKGKGKSGTASRDKNVSGAADCGESRGEELEQFLSWARASIFIYSDRTRRSRPPRSRRRSPAFPLPP